MDDESLSKANKAVEQRLAAQELRIAKLELHRAQLSKLADEKEADVERLRNLLRDAELR